jgi:hypothetical protein
MEASLSDGDIIRPMIVMNIRIQKLKLTFRW